MIAKNAKHDLDYFVSFMRDKLKGMRAGERI